MDSNTIKRYTNLASLVSILQNKELTFLSPTTWEDKNDSHYLINFCNRKGFESLYALCFTTANETAHHWRTFCPGSDGVCVRFRRDEFVGWLKTHDEIIHGQVKYKLIEDVESEDFTVNELPFFKRNQFRNEEEYRVLYTVKERKAQKSRHNPPAVLSIPFELSLIQEITLSNSLPSGLRLPLVNLLHSIKDCANIRIRRSTLNDNKRWKDACIRAKE